MRQQILTLLLLGNAMLAFAQKDLPAFGKIDKEDLELKECEFDKNAEAYKLVSYGSVRYVIIGDDFAIETDHRERVKILKEKGLEYANVKLKFYSKNSYETIKDITAFTYNLDNAGNIVKTKLEKASVYTKKLNNRFSEVSFTLPDVKVGSVIEYKYTNIKKSIGNLADWYFQEEIPTRFSMYKIRVPNIFKFVNQLLVYQPVEQKSNEVRESGAYKGRLLSYNAAEKSYIVRNIPALTEEPYMGAARDYLQRVQFQLSRIDYGHGDVTEVMSTWPKLTKELLEDEDFGLQLKKNIPGTKALTDSLQKTRTLYERMVVIHDYVRKNMNWNGGESIYSSDGIKSAWDKKSGSNSEINLILINLLREAGLKAYPVLVSTKDNGSVTPVYPFLQQFNNAMACVMIDNERYILNGADRYNPAHLVPYDVVDNEGFIVDNEAGAWIVLSNNKSVSRSAVSMFAEITPDAVMKGKAVVYSSGYCKNPRVKTWMEDKKSFKDYFSKDNSGMKVENITVNNEHNDSLALEQKLEFSLPVNATGDYEYFTVNLFQGLEKNPFVADRRVTDIDFNYKQSYVLTGKIFIPEGFEFDELPKNIKMIMPDSGIVFQRIMQHDANSVDLRINLDFKRSFYEAVNYPEFQEFYKKLFTTLNEQVVIKKKKA